MPRYLIIIIILLIHFPVSGQDKVRIRLFTESNSGNALFSVIEGRYELNNFSGQPVEIVPGNNILISVFKNRLVIKQRSRPALVCDSLFITGKTGQDVFSLRADGMRRFYSGDLHSFNYPGSILFINICDTESYIAGVVQAEGGTGRHKEYVKTQAVIARTYLFKYFDKHILDRYNMCDDTHCQAFKGLSDDTLIIHAVQETRDQVIIGPDSILIIAAFHSNCGGETAPAEDVWLTVQPYLRKITDPFCTSSRNARWEKSIGLEDWLAYLRKMGYNQDSSSQTSLNYTQLTRMKDYRAGDFSLPLKQIRSDMDLRSAFFSLAVKGDSVIIKGRGYGHGVGLCQEGAMTMAQKGFDYRQIINFYYTGVIITDINNAVEEKE
jgi:stage II sporulation protein D